MVPFPARLSHRGIAVRNHAFLTNTVDETSAASTRNMLYAGDSISAEIHAVRLSIRPIIHTGCGLTVGYACQLRV